MPTPAAAGPFPHVIHERILCAVHQVPDPARVVVEPDAVAPALAPGALGERDHGGWRDLEEVLRGGCGGNVALEATEDRLEPYRALEPPVAEELGVERCDDDTGPARRAVMGPKGFSDGRHEVVRVGSGPLGRCARIVRGLVVEGHGPTRDAPVPE